MLSQDVAQLEKNNKKDLTGLVGYLKGKLEELESYRLIEKRVRSLESNLIENIQYTRRESIEIHGIPESVKDEQLEEKVIDVLEEIGVGRVKSYRIHACHRLKNRSKAVIRFVSRKNADLALHHRGKLKDFDVAKHGFNADTKLFINESLCPQMQYLCYLARTCKKQKTIDSYNLWKGRLTIKMGGTDTQIHIRHIEDLIDLGLATEDQREKFYK